MVLAELASLVLPEGLVLARPREELLITRVRPMDSRDERHHSDLWKYVDLKEKLL